MENTFNLKKFLVENKLTNNSRLLENEGASPTPEAAAAIVTKAVNKLENDPAIQKAAQAIAKDPKALEQLKNVLTSSGINPAELSENIDSNIVHKLALRMAKKSEELSETGNIQEEEGADYGGAFWAGLIGGGVLGNILGSMGDVAHTAQEIIMGASNSSHMTEVMIGAVAGAILAVVAKKVYDGATR